MVYMIGTIYVNPTYKCNLKCSHCTIRKQPHKQNLHQIVDTLSRIEYDRAILFGGEPLLLKHNQLSYMFEHIRFDSISTNLLLLNEDNINVIIENNIHVATSWNPDRFTEKQYHTWLNNLRLLIENDVPTTVLITMTEQLLNTDICVILRDIENVTQGSQCFEGIKFEHLVPSTKDLVNKFDCWLIELTKKWNFSYPNIIVDQYKQGSCVFDCRHVWSVTPEGRLIHNCPTLDNNNVLKQCLTCDYAHICKPCKKQQVCTFFKHLYIYLKQ